MFQSLKVLFPTMIDQDEAIEIARRRAAENGWGFGDTVAIFPRHRWFGGLKQFEIETNPGRLGTKARFIIDATTGEIISEGYIPR